MQWYRLAEDWSYVLRDPAADDVPAAAADDVPGPGVAGSTAPSDFATVDTGSPDAPGDSLEEAQVQAAVIESLNDQAPGDVPSQPSTESPDQ